MKVRQLGISITIVIAVTLSLYLLIAAQLLQDPVSTEPDSAPSPAAIESRPAATDAAVEAATVVATTDAVSANNPEVGGGRKQLEIHGRIVDSEQRPIANAVIAEERYFHKARSDADGYYRLQLEMPRHRYPALHFLRSGYAGQRLKLGKKQLGDRLRYRLDVTLQQALESVSLNGRVGDEFGIGLSAARVQLNASYPRNRDSFYLTEFTDELGNFSFEGIDAGQSYKLAASLSPDYQAYENPGLRVELDPAPLEIVLRKLKFVDIDGMILNRESVPVPNYKMQINNLSTGVHARTIVSDSSGYFSLQRFPVGEVSLTTRGQSGTPQWPAARCADWLTEIAASSSSGSRLTRSSS